MVVPVVVMIPMVMIPVIVIPVIVVILHHMILLGTRRMVLVPFTPGQKEEGRDEKEGEGKAEGVAHGGSIRPGRGET